MLISLVAKNSAKANNAQDILTPVTAQRHPLTLLTSGNDLADRCTTRRTGNSA